MADCLALCPWTRWKRAWLWGFPHFVPLLGTYTPVNAGAIRAGLIVSTPRDPRALRPARPGVSAPRGSAPRRQLVPGSARPGVSAPRAFGVRCSRRTVPRSEALRRGTSPRESPRWEALRREAPRRETSQAADRRKTGRAGSRNIEKWELAPNTASIMGSSNVGTATTFAPGDNNVVKPR